MLRNRLDCLSIKFSPAEHKILRTLRAHSVCEATGLVAVSGGLDSMLLLVVLQRLAPALKMQIHVVHIHHGPGDARQVRFRNRAQSFVQKWSDKLGVPFYTNRSHPREVLASEEALRDYRYREIEKIRKRIAKKVQSPVYLFLAHHQDDLVETQLMRLVRGTGDKGLEAMAYLGVDARVRPFLLFSRHELEQLAKKLGLQWCEDPSNQSLDPLRNWMRRSWLVSLERKRPGAKDCLARSLMHILQSREAEQDVKGFIYSDGVDRQAYLALSRSRKTQLVAEYLRSLKIRNFSSGQIEEICKRLDNRRVRFTFSLLRHDWCVNENRICAILSSVKLRKVKT